MSVSYRLVQWNRHKIVYDVAAAVSVMLIGGCYALVSTLTLREAERVSDEVLLIRASAVAAVCLLHVTLAIGPLARLTPHAAPLLYNRRHLGVMTFAVALFHGVLTTLYYGGFGGVWPLSAVLGAGQWTSVSGFAFEWAGFLALLLLALLAATSHDFWLKTLTPRVWKWLHMSVYAAYGLIVVHVVTGALQAERHGAWTWALGAGCGLLTGLHTAAAWVQHGRDRRALRNGEGWLDVAHVHEFREGRAKIVLTKERESIAVFAHKGGFHGISNVCVHQGGPLGEGQIIDGCVTCPWHGYQFSPKSGCSPPPFQDRVARYEVRVSGTLVQVRGEAMANEEAR